MTTQEERARSVDGSFAAPVSASRVFSTSVPKKGMSPPAGGSTPWLGGGGCGTSWAAKQADSRGFCLPAATCGGLGAARRCSGGSGSAAVASPASAGWAVRFRWGLARGRR